MSDTLSSGDKYGDFEIDHVVRATSRYHVYAVKRPEGDIADLKLSVDPVASEEAARRALRELAVLGEVTNRHVVGVHDSGLGPDDRWFLLTEHLEGAQLDHWHDWDRPLDPATAVSFIHQACLGLAEVHAQGIVHRDLQPATLWVEPDRNLKLLDFGSARAWGEGSAAADNVTVMAGLAGSPHYSAPEQWTEPSLTPAADVYSLGMMLYELLAGCVPFFADKPRSKVVVDLADEVMEWTAAHASKEPVPLSHYAAARDLPTKLVDVVSACLKKDPNERPADAGALANELGWVLHHDLASTPAATIRVTDPSGATTFHLLLPGSMKVGFGPGCEIALRRDSADTTYALLEWSGPGKPAEVRPMDGVAAPRRNGEAITERSPIGNDDVLGVEGFELRFSFPT